jgi:hypothetical protein
MYWKTPYYAAIGATTGNREVVKVLSVTSRGNQFQLTVIRNFAGAPGTAAVVISGADSTALTAAARITYSRSALMRNVAVNAIYMEVGGFVSSCDFFNAGPWCALASDVLPLPANLAANNLKFAISKRAGTTAVVDGVNARTLKWVGRGEY